MTVPAKSFQRWRLEVAPEANLTELCRRAAFKRTTLAQQLVRGKVSVAAVVAIARGLGRDPVESLSSFEPFSDLAQEKLAPTPGELLSQVSHLDVVDYLVQRSRSPADEPAVPQLSPFPHDASVRMWLEAVDSGDLRQSMVNVSGVAPQNISAAVSANRLVADLAVTAARLSSVSLPNALVVTGVITATEGGWPVGGREQALLDLTDGELVSLAQSRLEEMAKMVKKHERDDARTREIWETLG